MIELHSFSSFEEISLASKFALIVIGILSTLVTVLFILRYGIKSHYKMTNSDYAIAMILSFIACMIFPVIGNGGLELVCDNRSMYWYDFSKIN